MPVAKSTFANVANGIDNGIIPFDAHSNAVMTYFVIETLTGNLAHVLN